MSNEAEQRMIDAACELASVGWNRTKLYELLRKNLPPCQFEANKDKLEIRDIHVMIDILSDETTKRVMERYELNSLYRQAAILKGCNKTIHVLDLSISVSDRNYKDPANHAFWISKGNEALRKLYKQKDNTDVQ